LQPPSQHRDDGDYDEQTTTDSKTSLVIVLALSWHRVDSKLGNQENGRMKTTLDLPDALVKQVKLRAVRDGRKLKDAVADLLRKGLAAAKDEAPSTHETIVTTDKKTGLPVIECEHAASREEELTPERVADILLAQEVGWHHDAGR
jgi:plasmid stability protein